MQKYMALALLIGNLLIQVIYAATSGDSSFAILVTFVVTIGSGGLLWVILRMFKEIVFERDTLAYFVYLFSTEPENIKSKGHSKEVGAEIDLVYYTSMDSALHLVLQRDEKRIRVIRVE